MGCEDRIPCQQILSSALQRREDGHGCGKSLERLRLIRASGSARSYWAMAGKRTTTFGASE